jgi:hypothetical protein
MKINNLPDNYQNFPYIVARRVDGVLWHYGCYRNRDRANEVALDEGGETWESSMVERGAF